MAVQQTPLDEIQWKAPPIAQSMGGIHSNTVLPYFSHSPFFDPTSNNATLTTQATYNPQMFHLIQTREAFEGRLRTMQGLEFIVAFDPIEQGEVGAGAIGAWIIRKQVRRKRHGLEDEIAVQATYFVVGENVYMAPSVASVLDSRLLSTVTSLTKFLSVASSLPIFSPTYGYTYMPVASKTLPTPQASQNIDGDDVHMEDDLKVLSQTDTKDSPNSVTAFTRFQDSRTLMESYALSSRYQNDYMDESPLTGEPGNFILSSTTGQKETQSQSTIKQPNKPTAPAPKLNTTSATVAATSKKNVGAAKEKSPTSPTSPAKPRRRKSKAANSPTEA